MSTYAGPFCDDAIPMSAYEEQAWDTLNGRRERLNNRRGLPDWANPRSAAPVKSQETP